MKRREFLRLMALSIPAAAVAAETLALQPQSQQFTVTFPDGKVFVFEGYLVQYKTHDDGWAFTVKPSGSVTRTRIKRSFGGVKLKIDRQKTIQVQSVEFPPPTISDMGLRRIGPMTFTGDFT